ncbi:hypothetical protein PpBr36_08619 [Pyricularia pennisetigena]|uniref:hypothetical protein n=1 Tax=Pyricularia pennisetigena TaxID=1578925 RepID=UPI0011537233|nr:hypothetical protein PpBr36_08619 [Pyricularia pennisetigena]TLS24302.1 hypothetical protein PpBr36_08619 [Pyricularia pennisetigena]
MDTRTSTWSQSTGCDASLLESVSSTAQLKGKRVSDGYESPPLQHLHTYGSKPLPPAPARRSVASSMRSELSNAFRTPRRSSEYEDRHSHYERDSHLDNISVMLDASVADHDKRQRMARRTNYSEDSHLSPQPSPLYSNRFSQGSYRSFYSQGSYRGYQDQNHDPHPPRPSGAHAFDHQSTRYEDPYVLPKLGTSFPCIPPDEILSPQPKSSISKILQIAGHGSKPVTSPSIKSPTGHNSANKISQITGLDTAVSTWHAREGSFLDDISPVSPVSSAASLYSQDLETTISEPDADLGYTRPRRYEDVSRVAERPASQDESFRYSNWMPHSPDSVPMALNVRKSGNKQGNHQQSPAESYRSAGRRASRTHANPISPQQRHDSNLEMDLYHATTTQIARSTKEPPLDKLIGKGKHGYSPMGPQLACNLLASSMSSRQHKRDDQNKKHDSSSLSFLDRVHQSKTRNGPPTELRTGGERLSALAVPNTMTPKIRSAAPTQSVFDPDSDDESSRGPSTLAKMFKRHSGGVVEIIRTTTPSQGYSRASPAVYAAGPVSASSSTYSLTVPPTVSSVSNQDRVVVVNRTLKADGPDTPMPPGMFHKTGEHFQGLMAQAKSMMGSKSDRKRESLKSKIRVIPEGEVISGGDGKRR